MEYETDVTRQRTAAPRLARQDVMYLGASDAITILLAMRPAVFAIEMSSAEVKARAFRLGILDTIHTLFMGLIGYAYDNCQQWSIIRHDRNSVSYPHSCQKNGKVRNTDTVQVNFDQKSVSDYADDHRYSHMQAALSESVGRVAHECEKDSSDQRWGHSILYSSRQSCGS